MRLAWLFVAGMAGMVAAVGALITCLLFNSSVESFTTIVKVGLVFAFLVIISLFANVVSDILEGVKGKR